MRRLEQFWACMLVEALWCLNPNGGSQFSLLIRSILKSSLMPVEVEFYLESTFASVVHDRLLTNESRRELVDNVKCLPPLNLQIRFSEALGTRGILSRHNWQWMQGICCQSGFWMLKGGFCFGGLPWLGILVAEFSRTKKYFHKNCKTQHNAEYNSKQKPGYANQAIQIQHYENNQMVLEDHWFSEHKDGGGNCQFPRSITIFAWQASQSVVVLKFQFRHLQL